MRNRTRVEYLLAAAMLGGLLATGCMLGRIQPGSAAYVHVAANGVVTFWGAPVDLDKLPKRLKDAGVASNTLIKIVPHGEVSNRIHWPGYRRAVRVLERQMKWRRFCAGVTCRKGTGRLPLPKLGRR